MANILSRPHKNEIKRIHTGCHSLDHAFEDNVGQYGIPTRSIFEICGTKGVGKSTFMFSLAGIIANALGKNLTLVDFEGQNESTVDSCLDLSGFTGELDWKTYEWSADKKTTKKSSGKMTSDEELLQIVTDKCYEMPPSVVMLDSLAAFTPNSMHEGEVNDANIGGTAKILKTFLRRTIRPLLGNPEPTVFMFTNHQYPIIGGFRPGPNAPIPTENAGGKAVGYFATQSVDMKKLFGYASPELGGYTLEGKVAKNRDGFGVESKISFYVYIQAGEGISRNLTSVIDCVIGGLAESSSNGVSESSTISIDGQKVGKFRDLVADRHNPDLFTPFHNALKSSSIGTLKDFSDTIGA